MSFTFDHFADCDWRRTVCTCPLAPGKTAAQIASGERCAPRPAEGEAPELDSPNFVPTAAEGFAARGYERVNRGGEGEAPASEPAMCPCRLTAAPHPCPMCGGHGAPDEPAQGGEVADLLAAVEWFRVPAGYDDFDGTHITAEAHNGKLDEIRAAVERMARHNDIIRDGREMVAASFRKVCGEARALEARLDEVCADRRAEESAHKAGNAARRHGEPCEVPEAHRGHADAWEAGWRVADTAARLAEVEREKEEMEARLMLDKNALRLAFETRDASRAESARLRAEVEAAGKRLDEAVSTMRDYVERENVEHDDGCPEDDTCDCSAAPLIARINAVCALAAPPAGEGR